jgi:superfamily I DNA/RNA helicase
VLSLSDPSDADHRCRDLLDRTTITPKYDAILVDEAQDFGGVLLELVGRLIRPNRGGLTLSLDTSQNIRTRPQIDYGAMTQPTKLIRLERSHRSTSAIKSFSECFGKRPSTGQSAEDADDVAPVQLVWAENGDECVNMIVGESVRLMTEAGLQASEIMAVCFSTPQRRQLTQMFAERGIATSTPGQEQSSNEGGISIASPEVAKGHEASCVFLLGWDQDALIDSPEHACRRYVASSRAADILYVVYSSQNVPSEILLGTNVVKKLWPDDFRQ